jgi:hypothetical protein
MSNQIETQIDVALTERNRLTALFRLVLVVPMAIFIASFAPSADLSSGDASYFMVGLISLPVALAIVFRQIYPSYVLTFNEALLSLQTRVDAYVLLLTDQFPSIEENDVVSVTFPEVDAKALNRWLPLIKWFIAIPLYLGRNLLCHLRSILNFIWLAINFVYWQLSRKMRRRCCGNYRLLEPGCWICVATCYR